MSTHIPRPGHPPPVLSDDRKKAAIEYIEGNLGNGITLPRIACAAAMSPFHFARLFKAALGTTPMRYVQLRRIELAKRMLADRKHTLADIAHLTGFGSQSSFTTAFKRAAGMPPAAFRRCLAVIVGLFVVGLGLEA